jgi:hypothetical protein
MDKQIINLTGGKLVLYNRGGEWSADLYEYRYCDHSNYEVLVGSHRGPNPRNATKKAMRAWNDRGSDVL